MDEDVWFEDGMLIESFLSNMCHYFCLSMNMKLLALYFTVPSVLSCTVSYSIVQYFTASFFLYLSFLSDFLTVFPRCCPSASPSLSLSSCSIYLFLSFLCQPPSFPLSHSLSLTLTSNSLIF